MKRDEIIEIFEVDTFYFNNKEYSEIHISLNHINFDKDGRKRSNFSAEKVIELFIGAISDQLLEPDGAKGDFIYYIYSFYDRVGKKYKVAFCTEDEKVHIRIITLFRQR